MITYLRMYIYAGAYCNRSRSIKFKALLPALYTAEYTLQNNYTFIKCHYTYGHLHNLAQEGFM